MSKKRRTVSCGNCLARTPLEAAVIRIRHGLPLWLCERCDK